MCLNCTVNNCNVEREQNSFNFSLKHTWCSFNSFLLNLLLNAPKSGSTVKFSTNQNIQRIQIQINASSWIPLSLCIYNNSWPSNFLSLLIWCKPKQRKSIYFTPNTAQSDFTHGRTISLINTRNKSICRCTCGGGEEIQIWRRSHRY